VELLAGTLGEFKRAAFSGLIAKVIGEALFHHPNVHPADSELRSWEHSLHA